LFFVNGTVFGTTYYVDPNGSDDANGLSWATAFATIQKGIESANDLDVVEVNEGTYYERVDFNGVLCTLQSTNSDDPSVVDATIIDANFIYGYAVRFDSNENSNAVLNGFKLTGGFYGVLCDGADPVIKNCYITGNSGGIYIEKGSAALIMDNEITGNTVETAKSGIHIQGSSPTILRNIIAQNGPNGITSVFGSSPTIKSNWIYSNAQKGISLGSEASPVITNNTIVNNSYWGIKNAPYLGNPATPTISNCIIWGNDGNDLDPNFSATYSCIQAPNDPNDYWVQQDDLDILLDSWQKKYTDKSEPNCVNYTCADFDHSHGGNLKTGGYYRVGGNDLTILTNYWKLPDANVPGDCLD